MTAERITLRAFAPEVHVSGQDVYFAFPSGRLKYDCVCCGAKCCRGYGYIIGSGADAHVALRPRLSLFVLPSEQGPGYHVSNCPPACFFLTDEGRCGIHEAQGHDAKPETCRLFPFNNLRLFGHFLVVAPHTTICPLEITPAAETSHESRYATLLSEMASQGIDANIPVMSPPDGDAAL